MPLSQFTDTRIEVSFKTPAVLVRSPENEVGMQYVVEDQELFDDTLPHEDSHDSHDTPMFGLTPPAIKLFERYQYRNSEHTMQEEEFECHERTNRGSDEDMAEIIDNGEWCPELHQRKFLVVDWVDSCDGESNQHSAGKSGLESLQDFVRGVAWAMVTGRTVLFREMGVEAYDNEGGGDNDESSSCDGEEDCAKRYDVSSCRGRARLDPWVPTFKVWKKEYGWEDTIIKMVDKPSELEFDADASEEDFAKFPKVVQLEQPPPLSMDLLSREENAEAADTLLDFDMVYGMILDETILFKEADLDPLEASVDSFDDELTRTKRYAVQASAARTSDCPLEFEQPCVIYQIGREAIGPSACKIELATKEEDLTSHQAVIEIMAVAGNAIDGVVLSADLPIRDLLIEFLKYRGRLELRNFQLEGCWH